MHTLKYIKSLDGLRAIAVLLVIIHHWLPPNNPLNLLPNGMIGVTIFFSFIFMVIKLSMRTLFIF